MQRIHTFCDVSLNKLYYFQIPFRKKDSKRIILPPWDILSTITIESDRISEVWLADT